MRPEGRQTYAVAEARGVAEHERGVSPQIGVGRVALGEAHVHVGLARGQRVDHLVAPVVQHLERDAVQSVQQLPPARQEQQRVRYDVPMKRLERGRVTSTPQHLEKSWSRTAAMTCRVDRPQRVCQLESDSALSRIALPLCRSPSRGRRSCRPCPAAHQSRCAASRIVNQAE